MAYVSTPYLFPFCIPEKEPPYIGPPPISDIGADGYIEYVDLQTLVTLYWRIKLASIKTTASWSSHEDYYSYSTDFEDYNGRDLSSELSLVCAATLPSTRFLAGSVSNTYTRTGQEGEELEGIYFTGFYVADYGKDESGAYWITIVINSSLGRTQRDILSGGLGTVGNAQFFGINVPLYDSGVFSELTSAHLDVVIGGYEWWPYDPGDGDGPIYDKYSGVSLRDPLSVTI